MENEILYGGVPYDILDCTRNLFWNLHSVTKYPQLPPQALRFPSRAVEASAKREWRVTIVFKSTHRSRHPKFSHAIWNPFLRNASFRRLLLQFHFPSNSLLHFGSITGVLAGSGRDLEVTQPSQRPRWLAHWPCPTFTSFVQGRGRRYRTCVTDLCVHFLQSTLHKRPPRALYNGHFFGGQSLHSLFFNPSSTTTLLQWPLASVPTMAVLERFNSTSRKAL